MSMKRVDIKTNCNLKKEVIKILQEFGVFDKENVVLSIEVKDEVNESFLELEVSDKLDTLESVSNVIVDFINNQQNNTSIHITMFER